MTVSTIGLDLAKSVFQIHGVDREGRVVIRRRVGRHRLIAVFAASPPCRLAVLGWRPVQALTTGGDAWRASAMTSG